MNVKSLERQINENGAPILHAYHGFANWRGERVACGASVTDAIAL